MTSHSFRPIPIGTALLMACLCCSGFDTLRTANGMQNLSQLSDAEKSQGVGQFQPAPPSPPANSDSSDPPPRKNRSPHFYSPSPSTPIIVGTTAAAGGTAAGAYAWSQRANTNPNDPPPLPEFDPSPPEGNLALHDHYEDTSTSIPMRFSKGRRSPLIIADGNALWVRDIGRESAQITNGLNASQLGWSGATGFESSLRIRPFANDERGFEVAMAAISQEQERTLSNATMLYTVPAIGFAPHDITSSRNLEYWNGEFNLLSGSTEWGRTGFGLRYIQLNDRLHNQVALNGVNHQIETHGNNLFAQFTFNPLIDLNHVKFDPSFSAGLGGFWGTSTTQLQNVVGLPGLPSEITTERMTGAWFIQARLGLYVPIGSVAALKCGGQLTGFDTAVAASQISHTEFNVPRYHLRTEPFGLAGLYVGFELKR